MSSSFLLLHWLLISSISAQSSLKHGLERNNFATFHEVPSTNFRCQNQQWAGYYSDPEADCQMFHICVHRHDEVEQFSFLCPNQTVFDQKLLVCVWWDNFDCSSAPSFYYVNEGVFEDLGNDFEVPETRSEGRSFSLDSIGSEPEGRSLTEVENDISTFGKSLESDKNLESEKTHTKSQSISKQRTDDKSLRAVSNDRTTESYVGQIQNDKNVQSEHKRSKTKITADVSSGDENSEIKKETSLKDVTKKLANDKSLEQLRTKEKENLKENIRETVQISHQAQETQKIKKPQRITTIQPDKLFSVQKSAPPKRKELNVELRNLSPPKKRLDNNSLKINPQISVSDSQSPKHNAKEVSQASPVDEKKKVSVTVSKPFPTPQPTLSSIQTTTSKTNRERISSGITEILKPKVQTSLENERKVVSQTLVKQPSKKIAPQPGVSSSPRFASHRTSAGQVSSLQTIPEVTSQASVAGRKKETLTSSRESSKQFAPQTTSSKSSQFPPRENNTIQRSRSKSTLQTFISSEKGEKEKTSATSSQVTPRTKQDNRFKYPSQETSTETVSSRHREEPTASTQIPQDGKEKNISGFPSSQAKSLKKAEHTQGENISKPSRVVSAIPKSIGEKGGDEVKSSSKGQRPTIQRTSSPRQQINANVNNRLRNSTGKTSRPKPTSRFSSSPARNLSGGLTAYGILQDLLRNITIIRSKALVESESSGKDGNIRRNRKVNGPNIKILDVRQEKTVPVKISENRDSFVGLKTSKTKDEENTNELLSSSGSLYQIGRPGYIPAASKKPEVSKNYQSIFSTCAFGYKNDGKLSGCTNGPTSVKRINETFVSSAFEIPLPKNTNLYSKYSHGSTAQLQSSDKLSNLNAEKITSLRTPTEKHKILNVPGKEVPQTIPRIPLLTQSNRESFNHYLLPPPIKSLTSSEEEAPVIIVSRADAENNDHNQKKVYFNTIKSDEKKKANQKLFGAHLNLELPKQSTRVPYSTPPVPKRKISWADYVNSSKTESGDKTKQTGDAESSSSYGDVFRSHNNQTNSYGSSSTPSYGLY